MTKKTVLQKILNERDSVIQNFKENLRENLYKSTMSLNEKSKIIKLILKDKMLEKDKKVLIPILSKLSTEELIDLIDLGKVKGDFAQYVNVTQDFLTKLLENLYDIIILSGLHKNCLSKRSSSVHQERISELIFKSSKRIRGWLSSAKNNLKFFISEEDLTILRLSLIELFGKAHSKLCLELIDNYEKQNRYYIRRHRTEQWLTYNPTLKGRIFKYIETYEDLDIWYFFGLMCSDGYVRTIPKDTQGKYHYTISLDLQSGDKNIICKFASFLGFNDERIRDEVRGDSRLIFECRSMVEDLKELGIFGSKTKRKSVPPIIKKILTKARIEMDDLGLSNIWLTPSGKKALAWLKGFYDGDGLKGTTGIVCENKEFLDQIKLLFDTPYDSYKPDGLNTYQLSLGSIRFNRMLDAYIEGIKRVPVDKFDESKERSFIVKKTLLKLNISIRKIKMLTNYCSLKELGKLFRCSNTGAQKLLKEFGLNEEIPQKKQRPTKEVEKLYDYIDYHVEQALRRYGATQF